MGLQDLEVQKKDRAEGPIPDLRIPGARTTIEVVQAFDHIDREWLSGQPVCELLAKHTILHAGVMHAQSPFEISRSNQSGTFMLACFCLLYTSPSPRDRG